MEKKKVVKYKASLTVEAALILPIVFFSILAFLYFIQIMFFQENIQSAITEVAKSSSEYAYVYNELKNEECDVEKATLDKEKTNKNSEEKSRDKKIIGKIIDAMYFKNQTELFIKDSIKEQSFLVHGYDSLDFSNSSFMEDEFIDIIVKYEVRPAIGMFSSFKMPMVQRVRIKGFCGYSPKKDGSDGDTLEDGEEEIVFITETGTVYHKSKSCSSLKLTISNILKEEVETARNTGGGKYKECERCRKYKKEGNTVLYIAKTGDSYHYSLNCSGLKRTIIEIPLSQATNYNCCKRCG